MSFCLKTTAEKKPLLERSLIAAGRLRQTGKPGIKRQKTLKNKKFEFRKIPVLSASCSGWSYLCTSNIKNRKK